MIGRKFESQKERYKIGVMAGLLAGACLVTYYFHVFLKTGTVVTHIFYVPIILAAVWWKRKGLIVALVSSGFLVFSHLSFRPDVATINDYFRALMFIVIAFVVAKLSEHMGREKEELRAANQQLRAAEQQFGAANQQLRAAEQQFRAANQQLRASEQQLRAANQQLQAEVTERKKAEERLFEYQSQLKSLASQLTLAEEHERHRIATELHDQIGQLLIISKLSLDTVRNSGSAVDIAKALNEADRNIEQIIQNLRSLTFEMSSPLLYELGLEKAVAEWLTEKIRKKHHINTEFEDDGQHKPLDDDIRALLFRDVRELLTNVVRHAQAKWVKVSIRKVESRICVTVEDNGWGFDPEKIAATATKTGRFGLFSIRERLKQLGGSIEIESAPGYGTCITLCAPLKQETENLN